MFRYVALLWDAASAERSAIADGLESRLKAHSPIRGKSAIHSGAQDWAVALSANGVTVLVANTSRPLGAHRLQGGAGVVLGEIFVRQADVQDDLAARPAVFGERETRDILDSQGRALISNYWGNYVAVVIDNAAQARFVINDPTGSLPCYFAVIGEMTVLFSCLSDYLRLTCGRLNVNWAFVRNRVLNGIVDVETNPLVEISCVHRGERVRFDHRGECASRSFLWHPATFAGASDLIEAPEIAARALRSTTRSCVHSFAAHHTTVLQQTSGGLDSSIVLGCLADAPSKPEVICYTHYVPHAACDERRWARHATASRGYAHIEVPCDPALMNFDEMPALIPSVEPASCVTQWLSGPLQRGLATEHGATATFTGEGGDSTLCSTSFVFAVDQSIGRYGLRWRTFRTATAVAMRRDRTVWKVLAMALRRRFVGMSMAEYRRMLLPVGRLVHEDVKNCRQTGDHFPNPWFSATGEVPMEMVLRLGTMAFAPSFYDLTTGPAGAAPYVVSPLCAQPLFEVAARIPVGIHFDGGRVRGLARRAFGREVPEAILRRQWKDRPLLQMAEVIQRNLKFVREALLDGALVREGILNRDAVELALQIGPTKSTAMSGEILRHLDLELWIRQGL